jgi:hypothetical protein
LAQAATGAKENYAGKEVKAKKKKTCYKRV